LKKIAVASQVVMKKNDDLAPSPIPQSSRETQSDPKITKIISPYYEDTSMYDLKSCIYQKQKP
jgi:hypothetical protein